MKLVLLIVSWGWMILGVWWFFRPAGIRRRFEKRYRKGARLLLLTILAISAGILFAAGRRMGGVWGTVLAVLGPSALGKFRLALRVAVGSPGSQRVFCRNPGRLAAGTTISLPRRIDQCRICSAARQPAGSFPCKPATTRSVGPAVPESTM